MTVHGGDERLGLGRDDEAAELWARQSGLVPAHILDGSSKDNFWMMGDTGPCGPCTEIHIDLRSDEERAASDGAALVNSDDPRVMEIWNNVFIQYNALPTGGLEPLPSRHVDTGMGFERITAVLQGKTSNYDTDVFSAILDAAAALSPRADVRAYDDLAIDDPAERERVRVALRVVADHLRTVAFAIADGVLPGNGGRGYVIRRILRRAVRYGYQTLGLREAFLTRLVPTLVGVMGDAFPELKAQQSYIERVVRAEEDALPRNPRHGPPGLCWARAAPASARRRRRDARCRRRPRRSRRVCSRRSHDGPAQQGLRGSRDRDAEDVLDAFAQSAAEQ